MDEIIEELHKKYKISKVALRVICDSPFRFMKDKMETDEDDFPNFSLIYLGKIGVHKNKRKYLKENKDNIRTRAKEKMNERFPK